MPRLRLIGGLAALLALAATPLYAQKPVSNDATVHQGTLGEGDSSLESGEYYDDYPVEVGAGQEIIAVLASLDFDPYLILISPSGEQTENDDFGSSADVSLLEMPTEEPGTHTLRVTSYEPAEAGGYVLLVGTREADGVDAGHDEYDFEPETFDVKGPIAIGTPLAGTIGADDPARRDGSNYEAFTFQADAGTHLVITLTSSDFDAYLTLVSPSGEIQENDDQEEGSTDSRLDTTLGEEGEWIVVANTLMEGESGNYRLTVTRP